MVRLKIGSDKWLLLKIKILGLMWGHTLSDFFLLGDINILKLKNLSFTDALCNLPQQSESDTEKVCAMTHNVLVTLGPYGAASPEVLPV